MYCVNAQIIKNKYLTLSHDMIIIKPLKIWYLYVNCESTLNDFQMRSFDDSFR